MNKGVWIASILLIALLASELRAETVVAKKFPDGNDPYGSIFNLRNVEDRKNDLILKIFETGGGDPAMNGDIILLNISESVPGGESFTWETGLNLNEIKSVKVSERKLILEASESRMDDAGNIKTFPVTIEIAYSLKDGALQDRIEITKK